jgi:hypothetical protein
MQWTANHGLDSLSDEIRWHERYWYQREYSDSRFEPFDTNQRPQLMEVLSCSAILLLYVEADSHSSLLGPFIRPNPHRHTDDPEQFKTLFWNTLQKIQVGAPEWRDDVLGSAIANAMKSTEPGLWDRRFVKEIVRQPSRFGLSDFRITFDDAKSRGAYSLIYTSVLYKGRWTRRVVNSSCGDAGVDMLVDVSMQRVTVMSATEYQHLIKREYGRQNDLLVGADA